MKRDTKTRLDVYRQTHPLQVLAVWVAETTHRQRSTHKLAS